MCSAARRIAAPALISANHLAQFLSHEDSNSLDCPCFHPLSLGMVLAYVSPRRRSNVQFSRLTSMNQTALPNLRSPCEPSSDAALVNRVKLFLQAICAAHLEPMEID